MTTAPASPDRPPAGPAPDMPEEPADPGRPVNPAAGLPDDADRDGDVDVLCLAGQRPAAPGEWLLITAVDGLPGDVLVHLAAGPGTMEPLTVSVGTWAVIGGLLIPVSGWDRQDPEGWPEHIRSTVAFAGAC